MSSVSWKISRPDQDGKIDLCVLEVAKQDVLNWLAKKHKALNPNSDQQQISPCNVNTLSNIQLMRITAMITKVN